MIPEEMIPYVIGAGGALLVILLFIAWQAVRAANNAKIARQNSETTKTQVEDLYQYLDKRMVIWSSEQEGRFAQSELKNKAEMERGILHIREQLLADSGSQNELLTGKLGDFRNSITERFGELEVRFSDRFSTMADKLNKDLVDNKDSIARNMEEFRKELIAEQGRNFASLKEEVSKYLSDINDKVDERLMEGFKQTNQTFANILARLSKIDEAQKHLANLSTEIVSLQDVLTDKKSRGTFGEVQLNQILASVFGERNDAVYQLQYKMPNGKIADAVIRTPEPMGLIAVDSKFPLENYRRMIDRELHEHQRTQATREFKMNVRRHIDAIAERYIVPGHTSNQAIMFIPAEAVFAEIYAYHEDLIEYSQKKRVWLVSPTTLMSVLTTIQVVIQNVEREKYASIIHVELNKLGEEFKRYRRRWNKLRSHIDRVSDDVRSVHLTTEKISDKFEQLSNAELSVEGKERLDKREALEDKSEF